LIRTVLIDDETDSSRILQTLLESCCPQVAVIGTADGVETAVDLIRDTGPDLVFMDIEMTHGNAFDLLNRLEHVNFHVVFVSAFDNHAVRAFKYNALDYLLKPVNIRELCAAVDKLSSKAVESNLLGRVRSMLENMRGVNASEKKIALPTLNGLSFVPIRDIIRVEAKGNYSLIHLEDGRKITSAGVIKEFEELLPEALFFRIHLSHLINLNKIKSYQKGRGGYVTMDDDSEIEVASRRREEFMQRLLKRC
jgi:two-component system LytT family response regulator